MAGRTAAEKGKGKMVEEKKKEAALTAAPVRVRRRPGALIIYDEPPVTASKPRRSGRRAAPTRMDTVPPASRKRTRDEDVVPGADALTTPYIVPPTPPSPPAIVDGLISKALHSVVTVAFEMFVGDTLVTAYRTGFILIAEENYSVVLTTSKPCGDETINKYFVYFGGENSRTEAYELETIDKNDLVILIVQTDKRYEAVKFSRGPLGYEVIFTVCAMSGIKLNERANAPLIKELEGSLGIYKGTVGTPRCDALDASYRPIDGTEKYFQLGFSPHDDIITLKNVDAKKHTAEIAVSAPVFRLNGETAGMIFSDGDWVDSKVGLLAESIILSIETYLGSDEWEEYLQEMAKDWLEEKENGEEELTL